MEEGVEGKRRANLSVAVLVVTLLVGCCTLVGGAWAFVVMPIRLENRLARAESSVDSNTKRIQAIEDYKADAIGKLNLIIYQQGENKKTLEKISEKLNLVTP